MRKAILLIFLMAFIGSAQSQIAATKEKPKSPVEKPKLAVEKPKPLITKDTVKSPKIAEVEPEIVFNDSIIVVSGKFRLYKKNVHASYYANKFNGKRTSSGKRFDNNKYTAAHRKFPFGTILRVTNEENGKSVLVEVIDRGPFTRGREIDLTKKAFMEIATNKNSGGIKVKIEVANK
jgi:rare lipoprotein A